MSRRFEDGKEWEVVVVVKFGDRVNLCRSQLHNRSGDDSLRLNVFGPTMYKDESTEE